MRADRLLMIILLLQRHQSLTAGVLAERLGVSERTIYRDIDALSMAGVPVYTRTGPDGGCFLDEQYRNSVQWFTEAELQTLLYAGSAATLSDLGMQSAMENAILKLLTFAPKHHQKRIEQMKQRLYLDPSAWYGTEDDAQTLALLKEAVWGDYWIEAQYEAWDAERRTRTLAPYSLVYKSGRWYLVAQPKDADDFRTYRVSRLSDVQLLATQFERDIGFDITDYWAQASAQFKERLPQYPVTLRVRRSTMIYFQTVLAGRYHIREDYDHWLILDVQFGVFEEACTTVLGLGLEVEVIRPKELHEAVIEHAKAIVKHHT